MSFLNGQNDEIVSRFTDYSSYMLGSMVMRYAKRLSLRKTYVLIGNSDDTDNMEGYQRQGQGAFRVSRENNLLI